MPAGPLKRDGMVSTFIVAGRGAHNLACLDAMVTRSGGQSGLLRVDPALATGRGGCSGTRVGETTETLRSAVRSGVRTVPGHPRRVLGPDAHLVRGPGVPGGRVG